MQGGKPICEHQLVQLKLFDMFIKVETSRQLSRAAMLYNQTHEPAGDAVLDRVEGVLHARRRSRWRATRCSSTAATA